MAGRPTDYREEYCVQVEKLCKLGATDKEIADFFEVTETTINNWKTDYPEFFESIKKGKILADAEVSEKLYQRAIGYEHPDIDIRVIDSEIVTTELVKYYSPDPVAAIFWLKNRQKKKWRDKIEQGFTDAEGNDVTPVTLYQIPDNGRSQNNKASEGLSGEGA